MDKVIFDKNAYRYLVEGKSFNQIGKQNGKLKARVSKKNIETLISPVVASELLALVGDKRNTAFDKCLKTIKALYLHSGEEDAFNMIVSAEILISRSFFHATIPQKEETNKALGKMIYYLATDPS